MLDTVYVFVYPTWNTSAVNVRLLGPQMVVSPVLKIGAGPASSEGQPGACAKARIGAKISASKSILCFMVFISSQI
ncbi:hypothetical protein DSECCO2_591310 [anaerobic digester metagenome]